MGAILDHCVVSDTGVASVRSSRLILNDLCGVSSQNVLEVYDRDNGLVWAVAFENESLRWGFAVDGTSFSRNLSPQELLSINRILLYRPNAHEHLLELPALAPPFKRDSKDVPESVRRYLNIWFEEKTPGEGSLTLSFEDLAASAAPTIFATKYASRVRWDCVLARLIALSASESEGGSNPARDCSFIAAFVPGQSQGQLVLSFEY
jgi:hypothetical protein